MIILGIILGGVLAIFLFAAAVGSAIGLAIGVARFLRNPASLITDIKSFFAARRIKHYGR
jgi:hypothetical protein